MDGRVSAHVIKRMCEVKAPVSGIDPRTLEVSVVLI